ncbi:MAG: hypothetical protein ABWX59_01540 [Microbacteriaceae bacterium]
MEDGATDATNQERLIGIAEQVRSDVEVGAAHESVLALLKERCEQSGVTATDGQLRDLADRILGTLQ